MLGFFWIDPLLSRAGRHNAVAPAKLEPGTTRSQGTLSTTESLFVYFVRSQMLIFQSNVSLMQENLSLWDMCTMKKKMFYVLNFTTVTEFVLFYIFTE